MKFLLHNKLKPAVVRRAKKLINKYDLDHVFQISEPAAGFYLFCANNISEYERVHGVVDNTPEEFPEDTPRDTDIPRDTSGDDVIPTEWSFGQNLNQETITTEEPAPVNTAPVNENNNEQPPPTEKPPEEPKKKGGCCAIL